ncbi:O-antigen ligase family protein [Morganella morganii]|uniref:O-antigen ligase family protein n=1 Tax=Morganella morganii TaxID=582 RepID=UPI001FFDD906|nr:O-antigen ligase family protein [Morganella morganii]
MWLSRAFTQPGLRCAAYGIAAALGTLNILFMVQGRSGYVSLLAGTGIWLLLTLSRRQRAAVFVCGLLACLVFVLTPNKAAERLTLGFQEVSRCVSAPAGHEYHACDSSMGQRTAFVRESWQLIKQAPLLGNGAGSFWYSNQKTGYSVHNPHNEYLLATVQTGLAGLVLFLGWMACYFRAARYQTPACRALFIALLGSYLACHLFNSFLLDSSEGHLFVILSGILAGGVVKHHLPLTDGTD